MINAVYRQESNGVTQVANTGGGSGESMTLHKITLAEYLEHKAEYDASDDLFLIEDSGIANTAINVQFDPTNQDMASTCVQGAIEEKLNSKVIAPVQADLVAIQRYEIDDQFIYQGKLYKVTNTIADEANIVIDGNCELSSKIANQISQLNSNLTNKITITGRIEKTSDQYGIVIYAPPSGYGVVNVFGYGCYISGFRTTTGNISDCSFITHDREFNTLVSATVYFYAVLYKL